MKCGFLQGEEYFKTFFVPHIVYVFCMQIVLIASRIFLRRLSQL